MSYRTSLYTTRLRSASAACSWKHWLVWLWLLCAAACTSAGDSAETHATRPALVDGGGAAPGVGLPDGGASYAGQGVKALADAAAETSGEADPPAEADPNAATDAASATAAASATDDSLHTRPTPSWDLCAQLAARAGATLSTGHAVSWASLLCETVDLDRFTRGPSRAYRELLASSYDRSSIQENLPGWFGNKDFGSYLGAYGDEHVMMEAYGPGAIVRVWSANPTGRIRIYLDDPVKPAIDATMSDFLSGKYETPWGQPFVFIAAEGFSSYFPLPYSSYARVSTTSNEALYYQIDYRSYQAGTKVEPFSRDRLRALTPLAQALQTFLQAPSSDPLMVALPQRELRLTTTEPEQSVSLGPSVIRELVIRGFDASADKLRTTRLIMTVDGEKTVDAPLGDLFGAGPGLWPYQSLAASMTADVLTLRWPMPVQNHLSIRLESSAGTVPSLTVQLRYSEGIPDRARLFHAQWTGIHTFSTATAEDWTMLHYRGEGWYVGTVLNIDNPTNWWWGEGDEKISVDGEPFPSHFGTGTEDYFGLAWCSTELTSQPWLGQTRADGPGNAGRASMYRWHVGDAIPFTTELRFRLEVLGWLYNDTVLALTQDAVAYWYATPGGKLYAAPLADADFKTVPIESSVLPAIPGPSLCKF